MHGLVGWKHARKEVLAAGRKTNSLVGQLLFAQLGNYVDGLDQLPPFTTKAIERHNTSDAAVVLAEG
jgi:hypothetical protein